MANEESSVAFCDAEAEERVEDCVFIEDDLPHLRDVGVTRRLLHAARETSQAGQWRGATGGLYGEVSQHVSRLQTVNAYCVRHCRETTEVAIVKKDLEMNQHRHCADTWRACVNRVWRHQHPHPTVIGHDRVSHSVSRKALCWV